MVNTAVGGYNNAYLLHKECTTCRTLCLNAGHNMYRLTQRIKLALGVTTLNYKELVRGTL